MSETAKQALERLMSDRKAAYTRVFTNEQMQHTVDYLMADLATFCRAEASTFDLDPRVHALREGRREVYLRIRDYITLSVPELCRKYGRNLDG